MSSENTCRGPKSPRFDVAQAPPALVTAEAYGSAHRWEGINIPQYVAHERRRRGGWFLAEGEGRSQHPGKIVRRPHSSVVKMPAVIGQQVSQSRTRWSNATKVMPLTPSKRDRKIGQPNPGTTKCKWSLSPAASRGMSLHDSARVGACPIHG